MSEFHRWVFYLLILCSVVKRALWFDHCGWHRVLFNILVVEFLRKHRAKELSLTWAWPAVLSLASIVPILNRWIWPELFSLSLLRVSLSSAGQWLRVSEKKLYSDQLTAVDRDWTGSGQRSKTHWRFVYMATHHFYKLGCSSKLDNDIFLKLSFLSSVNCENRTSIKIN